jgi:uncharacterized protein YbjT (DUF2867 family)
MATTATDLKGQAFLVTGGSGYVGARLIDELLRKVVVMPPVGRSNR